MAVRPSVPAAARQDWEAIDLLSTTSGATDVCGAPINPQDQGDDVGLIIAQDAVTLDHDRQVEVTGAGVKRTQPWHGSR